jgi:hypothetical protein
MNACTGVVDGWTRKRKLTAGPATNMTAMLVASSTLVPTSVTVNDFPSATVERTRRVQIPVSSVTHGDVSEFPPPVAVSATARPESGRFNTSLRDTVTTISSLPSATADTLSSCTLDRATSTPGERSTGVEKSGGGERSTGSARSQRRRDQAAPTDPR